MGYGDITFEKKEPKYKVGEIVYFLDIFTNYEIPTVRQGQIIFAGNKQCFTTSSFGIRLVHGNYYEIESNGKNYRTSEDFICKNKKIAKKEFSYAKFEL